MKILNLSYLNEPNLPEHTWMHRSVNDLVNGDWWSLIEEIYKFSPDIILEREYNNFRAFYDPIYKVFPDVPRGWWYIDSHISFDRRRQYMKNFTHIFMAVSAYVEPAKKFLGHDNVSWLPLCWPSSSLPPVSTAPKAIDVSFVGRFEPAQYWKGRLECIDRLKQEYGDRALITTNYNNMIGIMQNSKVTVNYEIGGDLNFRNFEAMACGTELVTHKTPDMDKIPLFTNACLVYNTLDEMIQMINGILEGKTKSDTIAVREWVADNHTLNHRYQSMIQEASNAK